MGVCVGVWEFGSVEVWVCGCVGNIHLIIFLCYYLSASDFLRLPPSSMSSLLYSDSEISLAIRR